jgi:quercetin dioxygenase-like cupin family protein
VLLSRDNAEVITDAERRHFLILVERPEITITWTRYAGGERGPDQHVHRRHTDAFYVLDGELTFTLGPAPELVRLGAGGFVAVPPNVAHTYANESDSDASWINMHAPDTGFAAYLRALRDGKGHDFDQFDPPADGGLPADLAVVSPPGGGERVASGLRVTEGSDPPDDGFHCELEPGRFLTIQVR